MKYSPLTNWGKRSSSRASRRKRAAHTKLRSITQRRGNTTKPRLACGYRSFTSPDPTKFITGSNGWPPES